MSQIYVVGAASGDAGRRLLERADAVLYDRDIPAAMLDLAPERAERIDVSERQPEIRAMMMERARRGLTVAYLVAEEVPLFGQRIAVTRAPGQAEALSTKLRALGAEVIELPTIEIRPAPDYGPLDRAIAGLGAYDWLIFTSVNGVRFFLERLDRSAVDLRALRARICAIGPATRAALEALHLKVDVMGKKYVAEGLLEAFAAHDLAGRRILLPRAAVARDLVPAELARRGAQVDVVEAYRTVAPPIVPPQPKPDWITFTSSSTVQNFVTALGADWLEGVRVASIGPVTSATARKLGVGVSVEASVFTVDGLVDAILGG